MFLKFCLSQVPHSTYSRMMLSFAGGTVHMVCRNKERGESAQEEIKQQADNDVKDTILTYSDPTALLPF